MIPTINAVDTVLHDTTPLSAHSSSILEQPPSVENADEPTQTPLCESPTLNRILMAAVINQQFRRHLLADPCAAIAVGYGREKFLLSPSELAMLGSIRASTLAEFAAAVHKLCHPD